MVTKNFKDLNIFNEIKMTKVTLNLEWLYSYVVKS